MKNLLLVLAALFVLTTATVPSFADGNPNPHACQAKTCNPLPGTR